MDRQQIQNLLGRFKKGKCTPQEEAMLNAWFDRASEAGQWNWTESEKLDLGNALKDRIEARLEGGQRQGYFSRMAFRVAASVILVSGLCLIAWQKRTAIRDVLDPVVYAQSVTEAGKRAKIKLQDGTVVFLNAGSKLKYPEKFNRDVRQVELLEGEAFFDVAHDGEKPFVVISGKSRTQVLGTSFNIRSYSVFEDIEVTVASGKVAVAKASAQGNFAEKPMFLLPNERLSMNRKTGKVLKSHANALEVSGWVDGNLSFNNESLKNVATVLQNTYNVAFNFKQKELEKIRLSASFDNKDSFNEILFAIAKSNGLTYTYKGDRVQFYKKTNY